MLKKIGNRVRRLKHKIQFHISDDLGKVLALERVTLKGSRSIASLENGRIKIIKRTGKWDGFESTGALLEPHEALFLMEVVCEHCVSSSFQSIAI